MNSICKFMPVKAGSDLKTVNFVYEAEFHTLRQPFFRTVSVLHLVTSGTARLLMNGKVLPLAPGSLFFAFPGMLYEIDGSPDFAYLYISFMGSSAAGLLQSHGVEPAAPLFDGFDFLISFWLDAIRRVTRQNANVLTESVLLYTLSFLGEDKPPDSDSRVSNLFDRILDYTDCHFRDADMSLKKLADAFSYTEKYLSSLFKKRMSMRFTEYLNKLRVQYAAELMNGGCLSVSDAAARCGYSNPYYFSKVFKARMGCTPSQYMARLAAPNEPSESSPPTSTTGGIKP